MALDFTIITDVRQRFGDYTRGENESPSEGPSGMEADTPIGLDKSFAFRCPAVDRGQFAILLFQTLGVSVRQGLEINGQTIFGGIAPSVDFESRMLGSGSEAHQDRSAIARWNGNVMLVHPNVLQENNILRVRAAEMTAGNVDDFVMDNVVVVFKTGRSSVVAPRSVVATPKARQKKRAAKRAKKRR